MHLAGRERWLEGVAVSVRDHQHGSVGGVDGHDRDEAGSLLEVERVEVERRGHVAGSDVRTRRPRVAHRLFDLGDRERSVVQGAGEECGVRTRDERRDHVLGRAGAARRDHGHLHSVADGLDELDVVAVTRAVAIDARDQELTGPRATHSIAQSTASRPVPAVAMCVRTSQPPSTRAASNSPPRTASRTRSPPR